MVIELFSVSMIIIYAILFGICMKIADLLDEHGLKLFKGSAIIFGILWGLFGFFLVLSNNIIANIMLAMILAFFIRNRLDYMNHKIASLIIIVSFLIYAEFNLVLFLSFFLTFLIFGLLKDYTGDKLKKKKGVLIFLLEAAVYYPISTFVYCIFFGNWIVFWVFLLYPASYDIIKYIYAKKGFD